MSNAQLLTLYQIVTGWTRRFEASGQQRFDMTKREQFVELLTAVGAAGYTLNAEVAVAVTLAVVAIVGQHVWPPPAGIRRRIEAALLDPSNGFDPEHLSEQFQRTPEFVLAFLLGWGRCPGPGLCPIASSHAALYPIDPLADDWNGVTEGARVVLRRLVIEWVGQCLGVLWNRLHTPYSWSVIGFPYEAANDWTDRVLPVLLSHVHRCDCATRVTDNRANARSKAAACVRNHNLDVWDPAEQSLWRFCEKAVKGFQGSLERYPGGFTAGMLHYRLWTGGGAGPDFRQYKLLWVPVVVRKCEPGNHDTVMLTGPCKQHGSSFNRETDMLRDGGWRLILDAVEGGYRSDSFWECGTCGNLFDGPHGPCPLCGGSPKSSRPKKYYFM